MDLSTSFEGLKFGKKYEVCVVLKLPFSRSIDCHTYCSEKPKMHCKSEQTRCEPLPSPTKIPRQIPWSFENKDSFNPFTDIKFEMSDGTFDGQLSGLYKFKIR